MRLLSDLNGEFCLRLTLTLLHFLWQGVAIALLAGGAGAALRRAGAAVRYWVFVAALGAMALCPVATFHTLTRLEDAPQEAVPPAALSPETVSSQSGEALPPAMSGMTPYPASTGNFSPEVGLSRTTPLSPGVEDTNSGTGDEVNLKPDPAGKAASDTSLLKRVSKSVSQAFASDAYARVAPWVAGGYFAGVLVMLARLLLALRGGRGLRRQSNPVTEPALRATIARAAAALHLRVLPAVAWCERVAVPTVVGLLKPTILLPLSLSSGLTPDQIEMLLLHELAHLRRHDHWVNLAQWIVETAMFFHPAVWWVSRRIRAERELACDDRVLATGVAEASYADSLLRMAELSRLAIASDNPNVALALGSHGTRFSGFGQRVLRLIEGREALESLRPARVWPVAVALGVLLVGCYAIACRPEPEDTRQSNDPLGIRYRGLQVGLSDSLYNPKGEKIGERLNWQYGSGLVSPKEIKRRLIFDFPETSEPIFFEELGFSCAGTRADKRAWEKKAKGAFTFCSVPDLRIEMDGQTPQVVADIPFFTEKGQDDYLFPPVMDVVLSYYYGPPGESRYRFSGPFRWDQTQNDQGGVLCPKKPDREEWFRFDQTHFFLKLETPLEKSEDRTVLAYDRTGKRYPGHLSPRFGAASGERYTDLEVTLNVPIGEIETITIGEKPYEVWVKGIQVTPPGSEEETRNEMAEMARVFDMPGMKYEQVRDYDFNANPDKALRALPLLRGFSLDQAVRAIPPEKFRDQPPEFLEQLHQTALKLSQAPTPHWEHGIKMGIQGGWPEFYSLVLDRLADPTVQRFLSLHGGGEGNPFFLLYSLSEHPQELPDDLTPKIQKVIGVGDNGPSMGLLKCLTDKKTSATTEALRALSRDERPAVWIVAFGELLKRQALALEENLTPPEKIRLTVARAVKGSLPEKTAFEPEVESALLTILSDGAKNLRPPLVLDALHRYVGPKTSLRAAVEFLQKQNPYGHRINRWPIPEVTRWINQNCGVNIGELGTGSPNDLSNEEMPPSQLGKLITETCTWYEQSEYFNGTPLKRPFFQNSPEEQAGETKEAPLDIRFIGFQAGLGDSLYNAKGEKIGERLNWPYEGPSGKDMNWRFFFELPKTEELPLFEMAPVLYESGDSRTKKTVGGGGYYPGMEMEGETRELLYEMCIDFSARDQKPPKAMDVEVRYFYGSPKDPQYRFPGPFEEGKNLTDTDGTLTLIEHSRDENNAFSRFYLKSGPLTGDQPGREPFVLVYDTSGQKHFARWESGGNEGSKYNIQIDGIPLKKIASITIGEKPYEFVEKNVLVTPPGAREDTQAQLALIAHALGVDKIDYPELLNYRFQQDVDKTIRSLPYLRGNSLMKAWEAFADRSFRARIENLAPEALDQLHQTALKWAKAPAPHCEYGILMGLEVGWPEFDTLALDYLRQRNRVPFTDFSNRSFYSGYGLSSWVARHSEERPEELLPPILEFLKEAKDPKDVLSIMRELVNKNTPATTNALRALTKDDRPWFWAPAFFQLSERKALPPENELSATDKVRLAATLALNDSSGQKPPVPDPEVESLLIGILMSDLSTVYRDLGGDVLRAVHRYCRREKWTPALVEYIQKLDPYSWSDAYKILPVVRWINQDYGVNFGGVGTDPNTTGAGEIPPVQREKLVSDVVAWHKTGTVPGDHAPEKPVVLEFPADRSIGTTWIDSRTVELQGRLEMPAWSTPKLIIRVHPESFAVLEQLKPFKSVSLKIGEMDLQDEDLRYISRLPNLYGLTFTGTSVTKTGLEHLKDATGLKELDFDKARVPEDAWEALQFCSNLEFLRILSCQLTDTAFGPLKVPSKLRRLNLSGNRLTDKSLEGLKNRPSLKDLNLGNNPITDQGLVHLAGMKNLSMLSLSNTQITDAGLVNLSTLTELGDLNLGKTQITDAGLVRLPEMHQISYLDLTGTSITDASVEVLKRYPTLQMLTLTETGVTEQGIAELKKFLPHVYFPPPGFKIIKKENPAPAQPANGKDETTTSTTTTTSPVAPGEQGTGRIASSLTTPVPDAAPRHPLRRASE
jgi:beta-lactamase regulating signal transducer with metallopeptidase domain